MRHKAALIAHPTDAEMFRALMRRLRPDKVWADQLIIKIFEWAHAFEVASLTDLSFDGQNSVDASVYIVPFLPEMRDIRLQKVVDKVEEALAIARDDGCTVAAMGAFTSIVIQRREAALEQKYGLRITSGNTLTAAAIIGSVENVTRRLGVDIGDSTVAVIGATGDIGSACTSWFGSRAGNLVLSARALLPLEQMVERNRQHMTCPVELTKDNLAAVQKADIAVFVTSANTPIAALEDFRARTIVCDASAPLNVKVGSTLRPDVFVYHGGVISLPVPIPTGFDVGLASEYHFYGCQVEGLLIGLNESLPSSWGRGEITPEKVDLYVRELSRYPGLGLPLTIGGTVYSGDDMETYATTWQNPSLRAP